MKLTMWAKRRIFYFNNDGLFYVLSYSSYILRLKVTGNKAIGQNAMLRKRFVAISISWGCVGG